MQNPVIETMNAWRALRPVRGKLSLVASFYTYGAAELLSGPRGEAGVVFDHIGNTVVSYHAALLGTYGVARAIYGLKPNSDSKIVNKISAVCGGAAGLAVDIMAETPAVMDALHIPADVSDPKDLIIGIAGAALGACAVSFDRVQEQQAAQHVQASE